MNEDTETRLQWRPEPMGKFGRHFVGGQPVHCGDMLEVLLDDGGWALGRYEWNPARGGHPTLDLGGDALFLTVASQLRWPPE